jgi:predicted metal-dependent enzyme (double-stranded beta helix superfamily)
MLILVVCCERLKRMTRLPPKVIIPFPDLHSGEANFKSTCAGYGLQPESTPFLADLAETLHQTLARSTPRHFGQAAKAALRGYICETELLSSAQCIGSASGYRRHLLYVSPLKDFSIMSVVWNPGQQSPVHGHTAWGAVGVYAGQPFCENYEASQDADGTLTHTQLETRRLQPQDLAVVDPGLGTIHRIGNDGVSRCVTVHIYGRDLLDDPASINFFVAH